MIRHMVSIALLYLATVGSSAILKAIPEDNYGLLLLGMFVSAAFLLTLTFKALMLPFILVGMVIGAVTFVSSMIAGAIQGRVCRLYLGIFAPDQLAALDAQQREGELLQISEVEPITIEPPVR
ncbi:hypothetical protein [uncultured Tateyamaria sp.]|uniref:hypothetical protein n=1 Tax=uncultured Tateyamaria sp. TaxID=455651 RepID=UPI00260A319F|nr:hypothetical protein [uncultured Tateyamaria sp.]